MTIKDIARLSGCGVATVSRVLNDYPDVSPATRRKVLAVVEAYNFQPNSNAKHLKQRSGRRVAVIIKGTQNMLFAEMVEQVQARVQDRGMDATVYYLDEDANEVTFAQQVCREYRPPAILFLGGSMEYFRQGFAPIEIPCVLLTNGADGLGYSNLSSITTDDTAAAEQAMDHLILHRHRRIGILGGDCFPERVPQISYRRVMGCQKSFEKHGVSYDLIQFEPCRYALPDAYAATGRLLDRNPGMTAIFALSDVMAMGAIRALRDRGYRVPEDISVMGYDGVPISEFSVPRLATIRQDTRRIAERGVDILLERLERDLPPVYETAPFQLVAGESVALNTGTK